MATTITASAVKKHLVGLDQWLYAAANSDAEYTDDYIEQTVVPRAIRLFERETRCHVDQVLVSSFPDGQYGPVQVPGQYAPARFLNLPGKMGNVGGLVTKGAPVDTPVTPPTVEVFTGSSTFAAGTVTVGYTWIDDSQADLSFMSPTTTVPVTGDTQGITVTVPDAPAGARPHSANLYVSTSANSSILKLWGPIYPNVTPPNSLSIYAYAPDNARLPPAFDAFGTMRYMIETPYTYQVSDQVHFANLNLKEGPVLEVSRARLQWDQGASFFDFPAAWVRWNPRTRSFWILPYTGSALFTSAMAGFAALSIQFGGMQYIPAIICIDYVAGLADGWQDDPEWDDLQLALEQAVAYQVLLDIAHTFDAGVQGKSSDTFGFSQSKQYTRFMDLKKELFEAVSSYKLVHQSDDEGILVEWL